ncbi:MAG TPA: hypothetical protein VK550_14185 [Polyangiaceae bacterium]|nr:hypothetical protein [Polyangiaceae bacterium]
MIDCNGLRGGGNGLRGVCNTGALAGAGDFAVASFVATGPEGESSLPAQRAALTSESNSARDLAGSEG